MKTLINLWKNILNMKYQEYGKNKTNYENKFIFYLYKKQIQIQIRLQTQSWKRC